MLILKEYKPHRSADTMKASHMNVVNAKYLKWGYWKISKRFLIFIKMTLYIMHQKMSIDFMSILT